MPDSANLLGIMAADIIVLTGGPCAGKTTLLRALEAAGYPIIEEAARRVIEADESGELRADPLEFQREVLRVQLENEENAIGGIDAPLLVADRGIGDSFGYLEFHGLEPFPELLDAWIENSARYRTVFFLELNPDYRPDDRRNESPEDARAVHELLRKAYRDRHSDIVELPWSPCKTRQSLLLDHLRTRFESQR